MNNTKVFLLKKKDMNPSSLLYIIIIFSPQMSFKNIVPVKSCVPITQHGREGGSVIWNI
jgi:hypothetical protein